MQSNMLRIIHTTLYRRAKKYSYNEFPETLKSLNVENPTQNQVKEDYKSIMLHTNHPIFVDYVPSYNEMIKNPYLAWMNRFSVSK